MMYNQHAIHMKTEICIILQRNESYFVRDDLRTTLITVKITDQVSSIFNVIEFPNRQDKIVFNGQILCPTLTFDFYNIHNNDIISLVSPKIQESISIMDLFLNDEQKNIKNNNTLLVAAPHPLQISHKRTLFHPYSSNYFNRASRSMHIKVDKKDNCKNKQNSSIKRVKLEVIVNNCSSN